MEEPRYLLEIEFDDLPSVSYSDLPLDKMLEILLEYSKSWILVPDFDNDPKNGIFSWRATARKDNGMSWPEIKEDIYKNIILDYQSYFGANITRVWYRESKNSRRPVEVRYVDIPGIIRSKEDVEKAFAKIMEESDESD